MRQLGGLLAMALLVAATACGSSGNNGKKDSSVDSPKTIDGPTDGSSAPATFTTFVINLVENVPANSTPAAFASFSTLPDPDGEDNNTAAYSSLF
jgi:hypothetical protein